MHEWLPLLVGASIGLLHAQRPCSRSLATGLVALGALLAVALADEWTLFARSYPRDVVAVAASALLVTLLARRGGALRRRAVSSPPPY